MSACLSPELFDYSTAHASTFELSNLLGTQFIDAYVGLIANQKLQTELYILAYLLKDRVYTGDLWELIGERSIEAKQEESLRRHQITCGGVNEGRHVIVERFLMEERKKRCQMEVSLYSQAIENLEQLRMHNIYWSSIQAQYQDPLSNLEACNCTFTLRTITLRTFGLLDCYTRDHIGPPSLLLSTWITADVQDTFFKAFQTELDMQSDLMTKSLVARRSNAYLRNLGLDLLILQAKRHRAHAEIELYTLAIENTHAFNCDHSSQTSWDQIIPRHILPRNRWEALVPDFKLQCFNVQRCNFEVQEMTIDQLVANIRETYIDRKQTKQTPQVLTAINVLQLIIRQAPNLKYLNITRAFFTKDAGIQTLVRVLELWRRYFHAIPENAGDILSSKSGQALRREKSKQRNMNNNANDNGGDGNQNGGDGNQNGNRDHQIPERDLQIIPRPRNVQFTLTEGQHELMYVTWAGARLRVRQQLYHPDLPIQPHPQPLHWSEEMRAMLVLWIARERRIFEMEMRELEYLLGLRDSEDSSVSVDDTREWDQKPFPVDSISWARSQSSDMSGPTSHVAAIVECDTGAPVDSAQAQMNFHEPDSHAKYKLCQCNDVMEM
ncbi:uncharacterized protein F5891DRAFT_1207720 [Suillus fuscotomentosus]|uniref:Uncharacterized protein n=1 Tax=Suillus fuscotomentosus TaxID=1912939 RepID=A0AAD4DSY2_9AGAM|nr:uncharacterized protein F5891DRAFT_1207720 [Suillus fuscotomentosus]KAG1893251.1 hypothetical protein F5891DRAFT_1207720 [Suillus fuscotomentosus]